MTMLGSIKCEQLWCWCIDGSLQRRFCT